ncbi:Fungal specific transcription factor domain-containing protein 49 [Elsinoe fawcettii]|nr:Fungal specific transcription factor domain-containing protein 49 [Elsinoe fawcettii]
MAAEGSPVPRKRTRLSLACDTCRRRKVKCDTEYPKCKNCKARNDTCITTDPRHPDLVVSRCSKSTPRQQGQAQLEYLEQVLGTRDPNNEGANGPDIQTPASLPAAQSQVGVAESRSMVSQASGISTVHQPHDMTFNVEHTTDRIKMMGASSSQCLGVTLEMYIRSVGGGSVSTMFKHGMQHAEEMPLALGSLPIAFPEPSQRDAFMQLYFKRVHLVFPLYQIDETKAAIWDLASVPVDRLRSLPAEKIPILVSAYLIMSIGADEDAKVATEIGQKYLDQAASMLPSLMFMPYLPSVQALLLMAIALRSRSKDGVGWQVLGTAVRIAHTLGLHRHSVNRPSSQHAVQGGYNQLFHARIWAVCCCLEKCMQLEAGRPSSITDVDCDQMMGEKQKPSGPDFLQWQMGLAEYQGQICQQLYTPSRSGVSNAKEILTEVSRLDTGIMRWVASVEAAYRPGEGIVCPNYHFHAAAFLSIQYHQTMIALHRAALIAPSGTFESEIRTHLPDDASNFRLLNGENICVNSARSIARLAIEIDSRGAHSRILSPGPYLLACIVLGIFLLKRPRSKFAGSDLELLKACAECTRSFFRANGSSDAFANGTTQLYEAVRKHIESPQPRSAPGSRPNEAAEPPRQGRENHAEQPHQDTAFAEHHCEMIDQLPHVNDTLTAWDPEVPYDHLDVIDQGSTPFGGYNVEDLWSWMLNSVDQNFTPGWDPYVVSHED